MNKKSTFTVAGWVTEAIRNSKEDYVDQHFDIFKDYTNPKGLMLFNYACQVLLEARVASKTIVIKRDFKPFIYLPLGYSTKFLRWKNSYWLKLGENNQQITYEPPSIYLIAKPELLFADINTEEYRCPVALPNEVRELCALYRCSRDQEAIENEWEYDRGIYLFHRQDF